MIKTKLEFRNYMLGVIKNLNPIINTTPMSDEEDEVLELYEKLIEFIEGEEK